jgi:ATP-dependent DNA helicase RecG
VLDVRENITSIKGVGEKTALYFNKLGIVTVGELLYHYPFRYETFAYPTPISELRPGAKVSIEAMVITSPRMINLGARTIMQVDVKDDTGALTLKWFNAKPYMLKTIKMGQRYIFRGVYSVKNGRQAIVQPEQYTKAEYIQLLKNFRPVYPSTEHLTQSAIRKSIRLALDSTVIKDYIPAKIRKNYGLPGIKESLLNIHYPANEEALSEALHRIVFDEFFFFLMNMRRLKDEIAVRPGIPIQYKEKESMALLQSLGYELTKDQAAAVKDILGDMSQTNAMQRLLQGDVGSGKTAVALITLANTAFNGYQGCLMAPTEVLATQHYDYFRKMLEPFGVNVGFLTGSIKASEKKAVYKGIADGSIQILIGTHAAIQEGLEFKNLAYAVIDEQHRFGVRQREALELKGENPHLLLMSATPIPRTYALMLYGNMDISVISTLPANRKPIKNCVANESMRASTNRFLLKEIEAGHQIYVICPLVEESEKSTAAAVTTYTDELKEALGSKVSIEALYGKMKNSLKNEIMTRFEKGETNVLVSTTVIEVGVNVPNATVMLVENAENFGLAQLHQIRGRVGRGDAQSYCIFMAGKTNEETKKRLDIVAGSNDGFFIASQDMKLRGPGDFFGERQSGEQQFNLADPLRDGEILAHAKEAVEELTDLECEEILKLRNDIVSSVKCMVY